MDEFEDALYTLLAGDATLIAAATGGVWREMAAQGTAAPYVLIKNLAPASSVQVFNGTPCENGLYLVHGVTDAGTGGGIPSSSVTIDQRLHTLIENASLTLTNGKQLLFCRRERRHNMPEIDANGRQYQNRGGVYRVWATT